MVLKTLDQKIIIKKWHSTTIELILFYFIGLRSAAILAILIVVGLFTANSIAPEAFKIPGAPIAISIGAITLLLVYLYCYWTIQKTMLYKIYELLNIKVDEAN